MGWKADRSRLPLARRSRRREHRMPTSGWGLSPNNVFHPMPRPRSRTRPVRANAMSGRCSSGSTAVVESDTAGDRMRMRYQRGLTMTFPKTYEAASASKRSRRSGESTRPPAHRRRSSGSNRALREQLRLATIREVQMTRHGFYAEFDVPSDVPLAVPANFAGGNAEIFLEGAAGGAGCVLFIPDGRLTTLHLKATRSVTRAGLRRESSRD